MTERLSPPAAVVNEEVADRMLRHALDLWIFPELRRRGLPEAMPGQAQVLFGREGPPIVRLNQEVKGTFEARMDDPPEPGTPIKGSALNGFDHIILDREDADHGHITIVRHRGAHVLLFDFRPNGGHAREIVDLAEAFLRTAELGHGEGLVGPLIDNLYSCCELLAKARVVRYPGEGQKQHHPGILRKVKSGRVWDMPPDDFVQLYEELHNKRPAARYDACSTVAIDAPKALQIARREVELAKALR